MTTSPLKVEDSRADFESWYKQTFMVGDYWIEKRRCEPESYTIGSGILIYWECWKAARAEIVVELPDYRGADTYQSAGFNEALDECDNIIRAAGITVKGDSDGMD